MEATALLPLGMGLIVLGAGLGIGRLASAAAEGIARQPEAADKISGAVNLPLFLLEGVAILAEVFTFLLLILVVIGWICLRKIGLNLSPRIPIHRKLSVEVVHQNQIH